MGFLKKIFGTHSDHELKRLYPIADKIEAMSDEYAALTDEQLRAKTDEFKQRYADGSIGVIGGLVYHGTPDRSGCYCEPRVHGWEIHT